MATNEYFHEDVKCDGSSETFDVEVGTTSFAGNGHQLYLKIDGASVILPHEDAKEFCQAVARIASYFGYSKG